MTYSAYNTALHNKILLEILKDIYTSASLGSILGFKGGTAAMLFYGLDRGSVDLDFDLLKADREDEVLERVLAIAGRHGTIRESRKKRFNLFTLLSYVVGARTVKIEINRRQTSSHYHVRYAFGIPMLVMKQEDMAANKLMAMAERAERATRDIYDVWFFLKNNWDINEQVIRDRIGISGIEMLERCIGVLEKFNRRNILMGLGELLTEKQKTWARTKLLEETIFQLKVRMQVWHPI